LRGGVAGKHKDTRANDGADAKGGEIDGAKGAFEAFIGLCLGLKLGRRFASKKVHGKFPLVRAVKWQVSHSQVKQMQLSIANCPLAGIMPA